MSGHLPLRQRELQRTTDGDLQVTGQPIGTLVSLAVPSDVGHRSRRSKKAPHVRVHIGLGALFSALRAKRLSVVADGCAYPRGMECDCLATAMAHRFEATLAQ